MYEEIKELQNGYKDGQEEIKDQFPFSQLAHQ